MVFFIFLHPQEKIKSFRVILRRRMKEVFLVCFPQDGMQYWQKERRRKKKQVGIACVKKFRKCMAMVGSICKQLPKVCQQNNNSILMYAFSFCLSAFFMPYFSRFPFNPVCSLFFDSISERIFLKTEKEEQKQILEIIIFQFSEAVKDLFPSWLVRGGFS